MDQNSERVSQFYRQKVRQKIKGAEAELRNMRDISGTCNPIFAQVIGLMISTVNTCSRRFGGVVALLDTIGMVRRKDNQRET